ncbi:chondroitin AC lyase [Arachidicoccus rhizosphaerae]|uniref:Chondroitin AC lyase n=2 Tax=Arachidicoccus rhizosphaerae TaxID=551991 RepID=A0A1H4ALW5_9BACT|nr:chondroitin AC lyase [Arachidicoccus rhizosphaerae]
MTEMTSSCRPGNNRSVNKISNGASSQKGTLRSAFKHPVGVARVAIVLAMLASCHINTSAQGRNKAAATATTTMNYEMILRRIYQDQLLPFVQVDNQQAGAAGEAAVKVAIEQLDGQVQADLRLLDTTTGKYTDLNYKDHKRIGVDWMPAMERMRRMTLVYGLGKSHYYKSPALFNAVNKALSYFSGCKPLPYCSNWYHQGITRPQTLALCLINMQMAVATKGGTSGIGSSGNSSSGSLLPDSTLRLTIAAICKDTAVNSPGRNNPMHKYNSGANKSEIALGWIYIGALLHSDYMLGVGARELYLPLHYTTGEGIQYDQSFDMHYGYLYNGAYGAVLMRSISSGAWYLRGTPYGLPGEKLAFFSGFVRRSILGQIRGGSMDWNILGRGISRYDATRPDFTTILKRLELIDSIHKNSYRDSYLRMTGAKPPGYHEPYDLSHYWCTDFTVWRHPGFYLSLHGNSSRNHAQEIGNQENLKGYWGAEGVMDLMVTGKEYVNIFPAWDWKRLPGATLPDTLIIAKDKAPGEGDRKGTSDFCGGVSDSISGLSVYTVKNDLGLSYHKAWFMAVDRIYCLGTGITTDSSQKGQITTTLNQCWYDSIGGVIISRQGKQTPIHRDIDTLFTAATMPDAIFHGGIKYKLLPEKGYRSPGNLLNTTPLRLKVEKRAADWQGIGSRAYPGVSGRVFELSLEHGSNLKGAAYSYVLHPGTPEKRLVKPKSVNAAYSYMSQSYSEVVVNTDSIQAVYQDLPAAGGGIEQVAFYKPEVWYAHWNLRVQADAPCLMMLRKVKADLRVAGRADKGQKKKTQRLRPSQVQTYKLSVADPSQQLHKIHIKIAVENGKNNWVNKELTVDLPEKPMAGRTVSQLIVFKFR